ncbi:MerR family transcriptional regulator [Streptomyces sp. NPDC054919]
MGELAEMSGVSVRALRYYEARRLLDSTRSPGGQRRYPPKAVERVLRIQELMAAGLSSTTILEVLPCMESDAPARTLALRERLTAERGRLDVLISELAGARDALEEVIATTTASHVSPDAAGAGTSVLR